MGVYDRLLTLEIVASLKKKWAPSFKLANDNIGLSKRGSWTPLTMCLLHEKFCLNCAAPNEAVDYMPTPASIIKIISLSGKNKEDSRLLICHYKTAFFLDYNALISYLALS